MKNSLVIVSALLPFTSGYAFVGSSARAALSVASGLPVSTSKSSGSGTQLQMVDQNVLMGAAVGVSGLVAGIGLVAFTESAGERGSGVSEDMSTRIAGGLMEDVEMSTVADLGSLTSQLENALKQSGGVSDGKMQEMELTEEEKQKIAEDLDDGW
jgi:hypothetical protein